jgi:hypothetical protein
MSAIDNAVTLMNSTTLMNKIRAVSVYVARQVVIESSTAADHARRMQLAQAVIWNPQQYNTLLLNIVACDPDVCSATGDGAAVPDNVLIDKVTALWTPVATMLFPA